MSSVSKPYTPIDCNYYDRLEAWATTRTLCRITLLDENGGQIEVLARITNLYSIDSIEYMQIDTGMAIRLDALVDVNGIPVPRHC